jgi:hypothetical protein
MTAYLPLPNHDFSGVNADAELDPLIRRQARVAPASIELDAQPAFYRRNRARELGHQPVASTEEDDPVASLDLTGHTLHRDTDATMRPLLVGCHENAVAFDISAKNRREPALHSAPSTR